MLRINRVILFLCVLVGLYLIYLLITDKSAGEATAIELMKLEKIVSEKYPKESIREFRVITDDLVRGGLIPEHFVRHGRAENAWGGEVIIQLFPANAWGPGIGATINFVFGSVPRKDCSELISRLGSQSGKNVFQIYLEPSRKAHRRFPISDEDYCSDGPNTVAYTVFAK